MAVLPPKLRAAAGLSIERPLAADPLGRISMTRCVDHSLVRPLTVEWKMQNQPARGGSHGGNQSEEKNGNSRLHGFLMLAYPTARCAGSCDLIENLVLSVPFLILWVLRSSSGPTFPPLTPLTPIFYALTVDRRPSLEGHQQERGDATEKPACDPLPGLPHE